MRTIRLGTDAAAMALCLAACLLQAFCANPIGPDDERPIRFRVHNGYSVKSSFGEDGSTTCLVFRDKAGFEAVLYWIADHNPYEPIPDSDFGTRIFPVVIKKGNKFWKMDVDRVTYVQNDRSVHVYFKSTLVADNMTWIALIPLVLSIASTEYSTVSFYENGSFLSSVSY